VGGLFLASLLVVRRRNLWASMLAHFIVDAIGLLASLHVEEGEDRPS
jgi:membrane protease YdiL (CAAX protease family)